MKTLNLRPAGLFTDPSPYAAPEGAMVRLDETVMRRAGLIEPRPGFVSILHGISPPAGYLVRAIVAFDGVLWVWADDGGTFRLDRLIADSSLTAITGNARPPDPAFAQALAAPMRRNLYFTTSTGIRKVAGQTATTSTGTGLRPPLHVTETQTALLGAAVAAVQYYALRVVMRRKDENGLIVRSRPSGRLTNNNGVGGLANISVKTYFDTDVLAGDVIEVYRSEDSATVPPSDELRLSAEHTVTAAEITAKCATVVDSTASADRGATIYTAPSQEGLERENHEPPRAHAVAEYAGSMFFADCRSAHRLLVNLTDIGHREDATTMDRTGNVSIGSPNITLVTGGTSLKIGQFVWEKGSSAAGRFPAGTTVVNIIPVGPTATIVCSNNAVAGGVGILFHFSAPGLGYWERIGSTTVGLPTITVPSTTTQLAVGQLVWNGPSPLLFGTFPVGTKITAISGTGPYTITCSANALLTVVLGGFKFSDVVTIDGSDYYATPDTDHLTRRFFVNAELVSGRRLGETALHLATARNLDKWEAGSGPRAITVNPYPIDGTLADTSWPAGQMIFEERGRGGSPFVVDCTSAKRFALSPEAPLTSAADDLANGLYWSKTDEPEHVPLLNFAQVGDEKQRVMRIVATRDALYVFKRDGIWRLLGAAENWRIDPLDLGRRLLTPASVAVLGEAIYAWTDHGLLRITGANVQEVSSSAIGTDIEGLERNLATFPVGGPHGGFVVANPIEREILLGVGAVLTGKTTHVYQFSEATPAFGGRWTREERCAVYDPSVGRMIFGSGTGLGSATYGITRDAGGYPAGQAHQDELFDTLADIVSIVNGATTSTVVITRATAATEKWVPHVCDLLVTGHPGGGAQSKVTAVSSVPAGPNTTYTLTVSPPVGVSLGTLTSASGHDHVDATVGWVMQHGGDPLGQKLWQGGTVLWDAIADSHNLDFTTEDGAGSSQVEALGVKVNRFFVPRNQARSATLLPQLTICAALGTWRLAGLSLVFEPYSDRVRL